MKSTAVLLLTTIFLSSCGPSQRTPTPSPPPPSPAPLSPAQAADRQIEEQKNDDPEDYKILKSYQAYQRGEITAREMVNIIFTSQDFEHTTRVLAKNFRKDVRTGAASPADQQRFQQLAQQVNTSTLIIAEDKDRDDLLTTIVSVAIGGLAGGVANTLLLKVFKKPTFARKLLSKEVIPVFLSTGIIAGGLTGISKYISSKVEGYWYEAAQAIRPEFPSGDTLVKASEEATPSEVKLPKKD